MRIQGLNYNTEKPAQSRLPVQNRASFGTILGAGSRGLPLGTNVFRDFPTLDFAANYITKTFPNGTNILDYACSTGDEALSLAVLLERANRQKLFKIIGLDVDPLAIEVAKKGLHSISYKDPDTLIDSHSPKLADLFKRLMKYLKPTDEILPPGLSSASFEEDMFLRNHKKLDGILEFRAPEEGDVLRATSFEPEKPVGAVFFRNALYQLTGNNCKNLDHDASFVSKVADAIHSRLDKNGIFVIGNHEKDHLYLSKRNNQEVLTRKTNEILSAHKGFRPIQISKIRKYDTFTPTVWKKVT